MTGERRAVNLVLRIGLIDEIGRELGGWPGFDWIRNQAVDAATRAGWDDWATVAERLEWRQCHEVFSGHLIATFEVMDA